MPNTTFVRDDAILKIVEGVVQFCREQLGEHPCDKRRNLAYYKEHYPAVDFTLIETEEDELWKEDYRETIPEIKQRAVKFVKWLATRCARQALPLVHSSL